MYSHISVFLKPRCFTSRHLRICVHVRYNLIYIGLENLLGKSSVEKHILCQADFLLHMLWFLRYCSSLKMFF
jgi:hypothetical protein